MRRAIGVIRLSELTDESTSPPRQREIIGKRAAERGSVIVGWAEDLDISASKTHPMKRPDLAAWLARSDEYEEIIFWRLDRFVRRIFPDFADMVVWGSAHGVGLVSATEQIDLSGPLGQAMAVMIAAVAEMEAKNTSERVAGAHAYLRREGRWGGGKPPFGYASAPNPDGKGHVLVADDGAAELCREIARRVTAGESVNSVTADLNRREIPTPTNRERARAGRTGTAKGRDTQGMTWRSSSVLKLLRSRVLLGYVVHRKGTVTGEDGTPVVRAPAIISETEWDRLQNALDDPARAQRQVRTQTPSLLLRVASCALCAAPMYRKPRHQGGSHVTYYQCSNHSGPPQQRIACPAALLVRVDGLDALAEALFLAQVGQVEILERVYRPGVDHSDEVALVRRSMAQVTTDFDSGVYTYPGGQDDYDKRVAALSARLRAVAEVPVTEAGYEYRATGQTFADRWRDSDVQARRSLMLQAGWQIRVSRTRTGEARLGGAEAQQRTVRLERSLRGYMIECGVTEISGEAWEEIRKLVDPNANLVLATELGDPELKKRAALAAEGRPVTVPDVDAVWAEVLWPVRQALRRQS